MGRVAFIFWPLTRREEGEYPLRSLTDEQQSQRPKNRQPEGPGFFCLAALSLDRHVATAMLLTRLLAARQKILPSAGPRRGPCLLLITVLNSSHARQTRHPLPRRPQRTGHAR